MPKLQDALAQGLDLVDGGQTQPMAGLARFISFSSQKDSRPHCDAFHALEAEYGQSEADGAPRQLDWYDGFTFTFRDGSALVYHLAD